MELSPSQVDEAERRLSQIPIEQCYALLKMDVRPGDTPGTVIIVDKNSATSVDEDELQLEVRAKILQAHFSQPMGRGANLLFKLERERDAPRAADSAA